MESVGSAGNTTASLRLPIGLTYLGILVILSSTTSGNPVSWTGSDLVRTLFNSKIGTQTTMDRIAMVQDSRQIGPLPSNIEETNIDVFQNSITWPLHSIAEKEGTTNGKAIFFLNFGQELAAPTLTRRFLALNTNTKGFKTFDLQIQMGAYTTPQVTVIAIVNDDPIPSQETELVSMIRENQWPFTGAGEKVVTDLPPYSYRQIVFDGLDGQSEGYSLTLDSLELANTIDVGLPNNRNIAAAACNAIFGIQGTQSRDNTSGNISGNQSLIFDAAGNVDNIAVVTNQSNVQLRFVVDAAKTITGVMEIIGNPLST